MVSVTEKFGIFSVLGDSLKILRSAVETLFFPSQSQFMPPGSCSTKNTEGLSSIERLFESPLLWWVRRKLSRGGRREAEGVALDFCPTFQGPGSERRNSTCPKYEIL